MRTDKSSERHRQPEAVSSLRSLKRASVVDEVLEAFKKAFIRGELRPGQRMPSEGELASQFGVGRATIREAMKVLSALDVVEIKRGNGTFVVEKPSETLLSPLVFTILLEAGLSQELLQLRRLVQVGYCQLAAEQATASDWLAIERAARAWEDYCREPARDVDRHAQLDLDFHFAILDATHNPLVIKIGRTVEEVFFASIRRTLARLEGCEWGIEGHRAIVEAIRSKDPESIRQTVYRSLAYWGREVADLAGEDA